MDKYFIKGVPLTFYGVLNWILFNTVCFMAVLSHIRGTFADPGYIPDEVVLPDYVDTARLNICDKCDMKWKPERAHHCSECNKCIFKVSQPPNSYFLIIFFFIDGPSLPLVE
jgi:hypothetical protein